LISNQLHDRVFTQEIWEIFDPMRIKCDYFIHGRYFCKKKMLSFFGKLGR
jgi:hypothetical protein